MAWAWLNRHKQVRKPECSDEVPGIGAGIVAEYIGKNRSVYNHNLKAIRNSAMWRVHLRPLICDMIGSSVDKAMLAPDANVTLMFQGSYIALCDLIREIDNSHVYDKEEEE